LEGHAQYAACHPHQLQPTPPAHNTFPSFSLCPPPFPPPLPHPPTQVYLVGDPAQLPATVISKHAVGLGYSTSLFSRLQHAGYPVHMLTVQYRMHPLISAWPSREFYQGQLTDGEVRRGRGGGGRGERWKGCGWRTGGGKEGLGS
jgi:hypothetical protein